MWRFLNCDIQMWQKIYTSHLKANIADIDMVCVTERGLINSSSTLWILLLKDNSII